MFLKDTVHDGFECRICFTLKSHVNQHRFLNLYFDFFFFDLNFTDSDSHIQNDNCQSDHENGLDIENDDDYPMMSDLEVVDPNDMNRPRKIRR